ncbi:MAG: hypothetical protein AAGE96_17690 [Cyanobacteria bacterium P01_G01_bin.19]
MKDLKRIREEVVTILLLILTLAFTSSNITPESLEKNSFTQALPFKAAIQ